MCGIAGIIQSSPSHTIEDVRRMTDAISHRGPDGDGFWESHSRQALFGHRRLSIIDLSLEASQPMGYQNRYTIIHNGEIYNYIELKKELQNEGYTFRTQSDTEVILAAFDHWDDECVEHFDGMFAFVIWDEVEQEVFAARDRFGEKPFYYHHQDGILVFGSEMKAIWAANIPRLPNRQMLFNYITIGYVDNPARPEETFFENISRLPPASKLFFKPSNNELVIEKYWDIDVDEQNTKIEPAEAIERFTYLFNASIRRRLRSDVSIGSSLSGGLDSSSIVASVSQVQMQFAETRGMEKSFTAIFPGFERNEAEQSRLVSDRFHLQQHTIDLKAQDLLSDWDRFMMHQEEPVASSSAYAQFKVFELAKQHGVTVLLDGQGADEILAGYHKYYKWYWQELFQRRRLIRSGEIRAAQALGVNEHFGIKNVMAALFPDLASVILERQYLVNALRQDDLDRDFVKLQSREAYYTTPELRNLNGLLYFNTCVHGLEELLRYADRNSMAHGRELRLPFLSHDLVEFIFTLPAQMKINKGWTKWTLRKSMEPTLPESITWRKDKTGFEPPQKEWMNHEAIQQKIREAREKLVKERVLNSRVLDKPITGDAAYDAEGFDWRYLNAAHFL